MLPPFYELGRNAAFSAIDAHAEMDVDLRAFVLVSAAFSIAAEMEAESEGGLQNLPADIHGLTATDYQAFLQGYMDALTEAGR